MEFVPSMGQKEIERSVSMKDVTILLRDWEFVGNMGGPYYEQLNSSRI